jgi:hypothetical protein
MVWAYVLLFLLALLEGFAILGLAGLVGQLHQDVSILKAIITKIATGADNNFKQTNENVAGIAKFIIWAFDLDDQVKPGGQGNGNMKN